MFSIRNRLLKTTAGPVPPNNSQNVTRSFSLSGRFSHHSHPPNPLTRQRLLAIRATATDYRTPIEEMEKESPAFNAQDDERPLNPVYFALLPELDIIRIFDGALGAEARKEPISINPRVPKGISLFWKKLKANNRVIEPPHITIVHRNEKKSEKELWDRCSRIDLMDGTPPLFQGRLVTVLCDERVLCVTVEDLDVVDGKGGSSGGVGDEFVEELPSEVRGRLHITIGTKSKDVPAVESMYLVEKWKNGHKGGVWSFEMERDVMFVGYLKGLMV